MGGRLDAVNVIDADAALITNIALDHVEWLGEDLETIGFEKAGVLRAGQVAVIADRDPPESVLRHAHSLGLEPLCRDVDFHVERSAEQWTWRSVDTCYELPMPSLVGAHQIDNAAGVIMLLELLRERLPYGLDDLHQGLRSVRHPGRMQYVEQDGIAVWVDVAHNPAGVEALARAMLHQSHQGRTFAVFSALSDKDATGMAQQLSTQVDRWYVAGIDGPRGRNAQALADLLHSVGLPVAGAWERPRLAYNAALADAQPKDRLLVFGSFLCVADVFDHIHSHIH